MLTAQNVVFRRKTPKTLREKILYVTNPMEKTKVIKNYVYTPEVRLV